MYKTIIRFRDLQDNNRVYNVGDVFPRSGLEVSKERLIELSSDRNRRGVPLIAEEAPEKPSPVPQESVEGVETGVDASEDLKPKKKQRKKV